MTPAFNAWMWAHPGFFTVALCLSFAAFCVALFLCVKKLAGNNYDD